MRSQLRRILNAIPVLVFILFWLLGSAPHAKAATVTWDGGGTDATCGGGVGDGNKWSCGLNWTGDIVPDRDDVIFNATSTKNADMDVAFRLDSLTIDAGYTGTVDLQANLRNDGAFTQNAGTFVMNNTFMRQRGDWTFNAGAVNPGTSTVRLERDPQTVSATGMSFNHVLYQGGGTLTVIGVMDVDGDLTITTATSIGPGSITVAGNVISNSGPIGGGASIILDGAGAQTISGVGFYPDGVFTINKSGGTATLVTDPLAVETLTITSGTLDLAGLNLTVTNALTVGASGTLELFGSETISRGSLSLSPGSTVKYTGDGDALADNFPLTWVASSYENLVIDAPDGTTDTFTVIGSVTVAGALTLTRGELNHDTVAANSLTLSGTGTVLSMAAGPTLWRNYSTAASTITLGGDVSVVGVDFDSSGGGCGDAATILLRSTSPGVPRAWSGSGSLWLFDVDVQDQGGTKAVTVANGIDSGNNGANWRITTQCPNFRSIGTNPGILYSFGNASISAGTTTVTFAGGASLPTNVGIGDRLVIGGETFYIHSRDSATQVTVQAGAAASHTNQAYTIQREFNTLQAWENARDGNLVAENRFEGGYAYNDSAFGPFTGSLTINGSTTDATHFMALTVPDGQRHNGTEGTGARLIGGGIEISNNFTQVSWLEIGTGGGDGVLITSTSVLLRNMIVHDKGGIGILNDTGTPTVRNSITYNNGKQGILGDGDLSVYNSTSYNNGDIGIETSGGTIQNNISMNNSGGDFSGGTRSFNISADGSATGPGSWNFESPATHFVTPGLDFHLIAGARAIDNGADLSSTFCCDIDAEGRPAGAWDIGADEFNGTTAVKLTSFTARALDGAVALDWETGSELDNLGFHLYRGDSEEGPYEAITASVIPGLGSSAVGAKYRYRDSGLTNGKIYFYKLEDIETTGRKEKHGPVSATPEEGASAETDPDGSDSGSPGEDASPARITYGDPTAVSLEVTSRGRGQLVLELEIGGFYAEPQEDGSVRLEIPGFEALTEANAPGIPVKRSWVEAIAGRKVEIVSVHAIGVEAFTSLRPSDAEMPEIVARRDGTVRAARRRSRRSTTRRAGASFRGEALYPSEPARVLSVGFQGDVKKALVELAPLRWDASTGQLLLARRLIVRLSLQKRDPSEQTTHGGRGRRYRKRRSHDKRGAVARLATTERGLYAVRYEEVLRSRRGFRASAVRLSRQGEPVAFHLEPSSGRFKPGSTLYFMSEGASANPYGSEAVYELEVGRSGEAGERMPAISAAPSGEPIRLYWHRAEWEKNRYYQAALLEAPDRWLWDLLFAPVVKSYPLEVSALAPSSEASKLSVWLQGVSDFKANPDHHVRVSVNGSLVAEVSWDGKRAKKIDVELLPGLLQEGDNLLELENVGDTEASYSMVMLDRYAVEYPRVALTPVGGVGSLEGRFSESGAAELSGLGPGAHVLDMSAASPSWLVDTEVGADGLLRFRAESGRSYLAVSPEAVYHPVVTRPGTSRLKNTRTRADYLVIGPETFLEAAEPLLELRRSDGLKVKAVSIEEVYSEFGFGEPTPEAVKDFLSYAYHNWRQPTLRYVLLLGDATYDFKDHLQTGVTNQVPPRMVKTSYLWTASDPSYAAVNGEDLLPDLAIGRIPAATVEEVRAMVDKIIAYETGEAGLHQSAVVLIADNPDKAGNFEANADELAGSVLASKDPDKIFLSQLGAAATRNAIIQSFDEGASLVSYIGHGGVVIWASENVFNLWDVDSLEPQAQQPLLLTMNCLNGYFHFPYFNSLSEELVKARDKGAIAAFSPSGLSLNGPAHRYHKALLQELFNGSHERLGDAVLAAQVAYAETGAFPELLSIYHLLGDPALKLQ